MSDSPRWCEHCKQHGDHHTDRCDVRLVCPDEACDYNIPISRTPYGMAKCPMHKRVVPGGTGPITIRTMGPELIRSSDVSEVASVHQSTGDQSND